MNNSKRRRPLGKPGRGWEGNIEMDPKKIAWDGVEWIRVV